MHYHRAQLFALVLLRLLIGWHFLYEGLIKLFSSTWSGKRYLMSSESFLSDFFTWLSSDALIGVVDFMTIFLLVGIGLTLVLGIFEKWGIMAGIGLLALFYLAHPSFPGYVSPAPVEGNYFIVNKNLIEMAALFVLWAFPTSQYVGLRHLFFSSKPANLATK